MQKLSSNGLVCVIFTLLLLLLLGAASEGMMSREQYAENGGDDGNDDVSDDVLGYCGSDNGLHGVRGPKMA
jgi:hypothetical protein